MREKLSISVIFSVFPTLTSGASIARGSPRLIGQKPEPTIRRGMTRKSLPPGGRRTTKWWKEPFISSLRQKNTTKEIFLVVFVFSPLKMHSRGGSPFLYNENGACGKSRRRHLYTAVAKKVFSGSIFWFVLNSLRSYWLKASF